MNTQSNQVTAQDKASGKVQKITITSDKGRLSEDEIERMLREAEENVEVDKAARQRVEAKNQLEGYLYGLRATLNDEAMKTKIVGEDRENLTSVVSSALSWLEEHGEEDKATYDEKLKEVEAVANPIMTKVYQAGPGTAENVSETPVEEGSGPTVEEAE